MNSFDLTVSTPDGIVFSGDAHNISLRGAEGDLAVLPGHIPFITPVTAGNVSVETKDGEVNKFSVGPGILTVSPERVTLLVSSASSIEK